jgi:hypothetical protein
MLQQFELVLIRRKDCILHDVACSWTLFPNGQGYVVLTEDFFGWRSSLIPWDHWLFFPKKYSIYPLASIIHVDVKVEHLGSMKTVRIHRETEGGVTELIEFQIPFLHRWVSALRVLDIPVSGGEAVHLATFRGLMNDYGWFLWFPILGLAWMFSFGLWQAFHPNRNNFDFVMISFGIFSFIHVFLWIGIVWKSWLK